MGLTLSCVDQTNAISGAVILLYEINQSMVRKLVSDPFESVVKMADGVKPVVL